jgi:hypothetical protein
MNKKNLLLFFLIFLAGFILVQVLYIFQKDKLPQNSLFPSLNTTSTIQYSSNTSQNIQTTPIPTLIPPVLLIPTNEGKIITSSFTIDVPNDFSSEKVTENSYVFESQTNSILNQEEIGPKELKIEIYVEDKKTMDTFDTFIKRETTDVDGNTISSSSITKFSVSSFSAARWVWHGLGDGETIIVLSDTKKFIINKYPLISDRNQEFENIILSFKPS